MNNRERPLDPGRVSGNREIGAPAVRQVPIGIEKLLCRAAAVPELKRGLLSDPEEALSAFSAELSVEERAVLASIPVATLSRMIEHIDLKRHSKRQFMKAVVAATLVAGAGSAVVGCVVGCGGPAGSRPDFDTVETVSDTQFPDADQRGDKDGD